MLSHIMLQLAAKVEVAKKQKKTDVLLVRTHYNDTTVTMVRCRVIANVNLSLQYISFCQLLCPELF